MRPASSFARTAGVTSATRVAPRRRSPITRGPPSSSDGNATFATIYPGCYSGRWPHIHFEVYESLEAATTGNNAIKTSQLAFPEGVSETVYADDRYPSSTDNLDDLSLESDMVFGEDSAALQMAIMSGDNEAGYTAVLAVGV